MAECKKNYPGLYITEQQDVALQKQLIDQKWAPATMKADCDAYNAAWQNLWDNWGFDKIEEGRYERAPRLLKEFIKDLDYEFIVENKPAPKALRTENWSMMDRKMAKAGELIGELEEVLKTPREGKTVAELRLLDVRREKIKQNVRDWLFRIEHEDDAPKTWSAFPFDANMMLAVFTQLKRESIGADWYQISADDRDVKMEEMTYQLWDRMYTDVVQYTQPDRSKADFDDLKKVYFDVLDPKDYGVSRLEDLSKGLFLQAYWNGGEKTVMEIDNQLKKLVYLYEEMPPDYVELWKECMKLDPTIKMTGEVSLWLKALDYNFVLKIVNELRVRHAHAHFVRAANRAILTCLEDDYQERLKAYNEELAVLPNLEESKASLREQCFEFPDEVEKVIFRENVIKRELAEMEVYQQARRDMPLPTMEEMMTQIVNRALFVKPNDPRQASVDAFGQKLLAAIKSGKGDIMALEAEAKSLLPSDLISDANPVTDQDYMKTFVTFVRAKRKRMDLWSLREAIWAEVGRNDAKIQHKRTMVMTHMDEFHDVIQRTVKHLIETNKMNKMLRCFEDYSKLVKRFKGEVYGTVASAEPLDQKTFDQIIGALAQQNPGKKFFLNQEVDPQLLAGFVVKCGPQKIDFSLRTELNNMKKSITV